MAPYSNTLQTNPMISSGAELLQFAGEDEYTVTTKRLSSKTKRCIALGIFSLTMMLLLVVGVYISYGMWDPANSHQWLDQRSCGVATTDCPSGFTNPPLILVSMDGFRASYLQRNMTPTLQRLSECGVSAPYMRASYPTKTFVNHYSIVTGLHPESHGIIDNWMFDPDMGKLFSISSKVALDPNWWKGEPIWNTVTKNKKVAGTYFWPGSDVNIEGIRSKYWFPYNKSTTFEARIQTVLKWLDLPAPDRPDFITLYFDEPDTHGHMTGPDSSAVNDQLERVDEMIAMLMDGLKRRNLHQCTNIILLADHGMSSTSCKRVVRLDNYINTTNLLVFDGAFGRINTNYRLDKDRNVVKVDPASATDDESVIKDLTCQSPHVTPTLKQFLPKRFHYANNHRIDNVILSVENRWLVASDQNSDLYFCSPGNHGYDTLSQPMEAVFMAYGPGFKSGYKAPPFLNVELYNLMAELLQVPAAPNNGTDGSLSHMLRHAQNVPPRPPGSTYTTCDYPTNEDVYHARVKTNCICRVPEGTTIEICDERLNMTSEERDAIINHVMPYGIPTLRDSDNACVLTQRNYITGFSFLFSAPLWTAYLIDKAPIINETDHRCMRPDVRLDTATPNCSIYRDMDTGKLQHEYLYPAWMDTDDTGRMDALILSNVVPMFEGFKKGIWRHLMSELLQWQKQLNAKLHVFVGPAYDYNYDGRKDSISQIEKFVPGTGIPLATHFYMIVTRCTEYGLTCCNQYDNLAFILPHLPDLPECQNKTQYLLDHTARVRDVELVTGLEFYSKMAPSVTLQLVTRIVDSLWTTGS